MAQRQPLGDYITTIKENAPLVFSGIIGLATDQLKPSAKRAGIGGGMFGVAATSLLTLFKFVAFGLVFLAAWLWSKTGASVFITIMLGFFSVAFLCLVVAVLAALLGIGQFKRIHVAQDAITELKTTVNDVSTAAGAGAEQAKAGPPKHGLAELDNAPAARAHYVVDPIWAAKQRAAARTLARSAPDGHTGMTPTR